MDPVRERSVDVGDLRLHVREEGDPANPTVLLVHGYPDNSSIWDGVAPRLAKRFHVVRFDVRGHGRSGTPRSYHLDDLAKDIAEVAKATSTTKVHLVGHDWGSIQSWHATTEYPDAFASFTTISGPALAHVEHWMKRHPVRAIPNALHSWYIGLFLIPKVAEIGMWFARKRLHAEWRDAKNGLELYRANIFKGQGPKQTSVPTLQIHLTKDPYVTEHHLDAARPFAENLTRRKLVSGHWAPRTHPEQVARYIADFVDQKQQQQLVLITGAGSGIGKATAEAFQRQGAKVIAVDIDEAKAKATSRYAYQLDVGDAQATRELRRRVIDEHGVPDIVMANAGIAVSGSFLRTSEEDWRRVVDVNLWGVVHTTRAFAQDMVDRNEGGHIVITASMAGYFPTTALPAYSTTKAAVLMLAECLNAELKQHSIGVTAICPGPVNTDITREATFAGVCEKDQERKRDAVTRLYERRGYGPDKVAKAVLRAVENNRRVAPVMLESHVVRALNRVSPGLVRVVAKVADRIWQS
ncbi:SDR family NAD(P)-dependent oxidoreductase [Lentzea tibetensis]|uniref:SDR family NAD(P)-dependent oxidoreductase n=1 Tax=Lentzea tibetensis TaxID=2591470 RepID=A0A563F210_9PSEU|nr:SDR family oxidoreductase [Lentzea tibetensis]TWP53404.1 SDR family NAD(P)-dependent oxidoreductase [Lentzea tibetensis]